MELVSNDHLFTVLSCYSNRSVGTSDRSSASSEGGMGFKYRDGQISHTLPTTRHLCNLEVWDLVQSSEDGHRSLVTPEMILSRYNKDLIVF